MVPLAMTSVDVQTSYPGAAARTRLVGPLSDGGECGVSGAGYLYFFGAYVPASGESIRAKSWPRSTRSPLSTLISFRYPLTLA